MPFPMRIQPIDCGEPAVRCDPLKPLLFKSRLKRIFDRPFNGVLRVTSADKPATGVAGAEFEPTSVCLDKMVQNFMEENNDKHWPPSVAAVKLGRNRCNCFNGNSNDSSDEESDFFSDSSTVNSSVGDPSDTLKSLIPCTTTAERNLLADASKIVERNKSCRRKDDLRRIVADGLAALGYNASVCKSKWEKSASLQAGEYEYIDVIMEEDRIFVDPDFRSEFEIARSTSSYKAILQCLPYIFVGKSDRLLQIVSVASDSALNSLKKKGMHIAPWRKAEYMKSKWIGPYTRLTLKPDNPHQNDAVEKPEPNNHEVTEVLNCEAEELDGEKSKTKTPKSPLLNAQPTVIWQLPAVRPKSSVEGKKKVVVTGLASLFKEKH